jgi:hypothetical protein
MQRVLRYIIDPNAPGKRQGEEGRCKRSLKPVRQGLAI